MKSPFSSWRAEVFRLARSEPALGSLKPWHQRVRPCIIGIKCSRFCSSVPISSSTGPSIHTPKLNCGGRHPKRCISCSTTRACLGVKPPPPKSAGQSGANQPRSRMRSNQTRWSSLLNLTSEPPQTIWSCVSGWRMAGGQLASSQARVSARKFSISCMTYLCGLVRGGGFSGGSSVNRYGGWPR